MNTINAIKVQDNFKWFFAFKWFQPLKSTENVHQRQNEAMYLSFMFHRDVSLHLNFFHMDESWHSFVSELLIKKDMQVGFPVVILSICLSLSSATISAVPKKIVRTSRFRILNCLFNNLRSFSYLLKLFCHQSITHLHLPT